jgi:hypothetical protein
VRRGESELAANHAKTANGSSAPFDNHVARRRHRERDHGARPETARRRETAVDQDEQRDPPEEQHRARAVDQEAERARQQRRERPARERDPALRAAALEDLRDEPSGEREHEREHDAQHERPARTPGQRLERGESGPEVRGGVALARADPEGILQRRQVGQQRGREQEQVEQADAAPAIHLRRRSHARLSLREVRRLYQSRGGAVTPRM